ncbi:MAG: LacI family DNA-binding transcriptional regulator [Kiritimatiellales bacterium]
MSSISQKRITIQGIADALNVSHTTVRKALNGQPGISEKRRKVIKAAAEQMGYVPNLLARSLKQNKSTFIGVVITKSLREIWYASLVDCLIAELKAKGYSVLLSLTDRTHPDEVRQTLQGFLGGHVAGVIAGPLSRQAYLEQFDCVVSAGIPLVVFENVEGAPAHCVSIDHCKGVKLAIEYLVEMGHRDIGYLCGDQFAFPNTRRYGYEQALFENDLPVLGKNFIPGESTFAGGYQAIITRWESAPNDFPDAIFCHSDISALGAMKAFREIGIRVPEDISLVGYDDIPEASYGAPALTTIGGALGKMAASISNMVCQTIEGELSISQSDLIEPELIVRDSVIRLK